MSTTLEHEQPPITAFLPEKAAARPATRRSTEPWLALCVLAVLGGISGLAYYLGFVRPYPLAGNYKIPLLDLAKLNGAALSSANYWALTWIVLFACYFLAFRFCPSSANVTATFRRVALILIFGLAIAYSANMLFMYPVGAADIFDQIFRARLLSHYGLNPFTTIPNGIQGDPLQAYVAWRGDPSPYGPVWELLAGATSWLAQTDLWRNLVLFKILVILAYGVSAVLTYAILRTTKPDWALRGTLFFAWNPLVVFEVAGNGHNDAVLMALVLAAIYLFVTARRAAVLPAVMAAALAKFVPILLVPVLAAAIWRDRVPRRSPPQAQTGLPVRRRPLSNFNAFSTLAAGVVISLGMAVILYAPFWAGPDSIGALSRKHLFTASIPKVALDLLTSKLGIDAGNAQEMVRNATLGLMTLVTLALTAWVFLKGNARNESQRAELVDRALRACYEVIFFYLAFATLWFQPWYIVWLVALTAPLARTAYANRTILFCIGGVANYFVWDFVWLWNRADLIVIQITAALSINALPLAYSLYIWARPLVERMVAVEDKSPTAVVLTAER